MRTHFAISAIGHIFFPDELPSLAFVVSAERRAHALKVKIKQNCTPIALLQLMRHVRDIQAPIVIEGPSSRHDKLTLQTSEACLHIAQIALAHYEKKYDSIMSSSLTNLTPHTDMLDQLTMRLDCTNAVSDALQILAKMRLKDLDTATALTHFTEDQLHHAAFFYPDAEQKLHIGKLPMERVWPSDAQLVGDESAFDWVIEPYGFWLRLVFEAALATGQPLLQQGYLSLEPTPNQKQIWDSKAKIRGKHTSAKPTEFVRLLYPLRSSSEKPSNYRLITIGCTLPDTLSIL